MQRPTAILVLAAVAVLMGLRLAAAAQDTEAMRCAIACGHAASATKGAACCPMSAPGSGPSFKTCAAGDGLALIPLAPGQPALLSASNSLNARQTHRLVPPVSHRAPAFPDPRPLDHVPLLFG